MEVSLIEADGIPEGCLISIRAGTMRRQAPVEANKPCKLLFPNAVSCANPFKVDLLAPLGNTEFEVSAASQRYPFEVKSRYGGKSMRVTLRVREDHSKTAHFENEFDSIVGFGENFDGFSASGSPSRRNQAAPEQRKYLDAHGLLPWMNGLMQELARDRPDDPWSYIDSSTERARRKSASAAKTVPSKAQVAPVESSRPSSLSPCRLQPAARSPADEDLRQRAAEAVLQGGHAPPAAMLRSPSGRINPGDSLKSPNGGCTPVVWPTPPATRNMTPPAGQKRVMRAADDARAAELRQQAQSVLLAAVSNGRLGGAVDHFPSKALIETSASGSLSAALLDLGRPDPGKEVDSLRKMARQNLLKATTDGTLSEALQESSADLCKAETGELDSLRKMARQNLLQATTDGTLSEALQEGSADLCKPETGELDSLRQMARQNLLKATTDGTLSEALQESSADLCKPETGELDSLRKMARQNLLKATTDGTLSGALQESSADLCQLETDELDSLRQMVRQNLSQAATDGRLRGALQESSADLCELETDELDSLRQMVRQNLSQAATAGILSRALKTSSGELYGPVAGELDSLRKVARQNLLKATTDGTLSAALQESSADPGKAAPDEVDILRKVAMQKMLKATTDGTMGGALPESSADPGRASPGEVDFLRKVARQNLQKATTDDTLSEALQEKAIDPDELESLRKMARRKFIIASNSGDLEAGGIASPVPAELSVLRKMARQKMIQATTDGPLSKKWQEGEQTCLSPSVPSKASSSSPKKPRRSKEERLFDKIDFKKDGIIDHDELDYAIAKGYIKRPAGFATSKEATLPTEPECGWQMKPSVGTWCAGKQRTPTAVVSPTMSACASDIRISDANSRSSRASPTGASPTGMHQSSSMSALESDSEERLLQQERFRYENESLRRDNIRLKKLREAGDAANVLCNQNDQLRNELGKLLSLHKKPGAGFFTPSSGRGFSSFDSAGRGF